jgi:alkanesulfonate monooxygenase SsuD/methylene tetrahydromethanopterin reductase-like flavin-dependent oxidoreductase (luciferase family)
MTSVGKRGYGVAGALAHDVIRAVAPAAEAAGVATFWANDTPVGDGLAALAAASEGTTRIRLGVGVIPVDRMPPATIAARVAELGLPRERLVIGIGSGMATKGALALVVDASRELRETYGLRVVVGALGPRMCEAAGAAADGVLLNWLTPGWAANAAESVRRAGAEIGRTPEIIAYVRVALGAAAGERLVAEAERYEGYPAYAAHFAKMGVRAIDTCVHGARGGDIRAGLAPFDPGVDEVVARAITAEDGAADYLATLAAVSGTLS